MKKSHIKLLASGIIAALVLIGAPNSHAGKKNKDTEESGGGEGQSHFLKAYAKYAEAILPAEKAKELQAQLDAAQGNNAQATAVSEAYRKALEAKIEEMNKDQKALTEEQIKLIKEGNEEKDKGVAKIVGKGAEGAAKGAGAGAAMGAMKGGKNAGSAAGIGAAAGAVGGGAKGVSDELAKEGKNIKKMSKALSELAKLQSAE